MKLLLETLNQSRIAAYHACPRDILEHAGKEESVSAGGYGYRQVLELVQNGADAILEAHADGDGDTRSQIEVRLVGSRLYVANTGAPLSEKGLEALLSSDLSPKRGNQIGRFGLGFKSLLRLGGVIDVFTRARGNIRFDPERCRRELLDTFGASTAPGLRLAWSLEDAARAGDSELETLDWAETIVRVDVRSLGLLEHLQAEIRKFPREFLLFLDQPVELRLCGDGIEPMVLRVEHKEDIKILHAGDEQVQWRVFSREVAVSDLDAVTDATSIHARKTVPIAWATPIDAKREEAGRFWAFFPTHTPTYLPGILNAPWKLNSDRNSLVRGEWNSALMREAAALVVDTLPLLSTPDDPGRPLSAFPRQPDRQDDDAVPMLSAIWAALTEAEVIANAAGTLRNPRRLVRPPNDDRDLAERWQALAPVKALELFVHSSCLEGVRNSRLKALAERVRQKGEPDAPFAPLAISTPGGWFGLVAATSASEALEVLILAKTYQNVCSGYEWGKIVPALRVIPTNGGTLATCGEVVFTPTGTQAPEGKEAVASSLAEIPEAKDILSKTFNVRELDDRTWHKILNETLPTYAFSEYWEAFWINLRLAPAPVAERFIQDHRANIWVRRRSGHWKPAYSVLLPGETVRDDEGIPNILVLADEETHARDYDRLKLLGVTGKAAVTEVTRSFGELTEWLQHWRSYYYEKYDSRPREDYLHPLNLRLPVATLFLPLLVGAANARLTSSLLPLLKDCPEFCIFGHTTMDRYPKIDVPHPLPWLLLRYGYVAIGDRAVPLRAFVRRASACRTALDGQHDLMPSLSDSEIDRLMASSGHNGTPPDAEIHALWLACIQSVVAPDRLKDDSLSGLWSAAAKDGIVPDGLPTHGGDIPLTSVFVTTSPDLARRVRSPERIVVTLDEQASQLWLEKGALSLTDLLKPMWDGATGPEQLLTEVMPELDPVLSDQAKSEARCQTVHGLRLVIGEVRESIPCLISDDRLLIDLFQLKELPRTECYLALLQELSSTSWLGRPVSEALCALADSALEARRAAIAAEPTLPARLLAAFDGRRAPLLAVLGSMAAQPFLKDCTPLQMSELVLAQLGPATLLNLRDALEKAGLRPPGRWNTSEARAFVTGLGFPESFANASAARREPEELVSGPIELPPLHDFQEEVLEGVRSLLASNSRRRRAVVSLPTGGGKTRVTVEAAVTLVLAPPSDRRSVIWIAQSDELCEQAVQAFRQVWINVGAEHTDLRIVRLWGGNRNPATQDLDKPLVVVASIQTLNARMGGAGLEWLDQPGLVVVDECHHAITPSYSNLLRWLNAEARSIDPVNGSEPPILGLSATPFRMDQDESRRLASRFGNLWFPADQRDLHAKLRERGVLAAVDNDPLESEIELTEEEKQLFELYGSESDGINFDRLVEALNQRLAGVEERNQRILSCVQRATQRSILLFANSVSHAVELSARLNLMGIPSAAISGDTPRIARRYFLEKFQHGELRVLCNHSVLSTGFDSPRTDMLLIARQVFSPVRYMQIVGRGLRGEMNGGTERCRIVTVLDNLGRFKDRHPYHYCSDYFRSIETNYTQAHSL